jgi:hypothetical protein
MLFNKTYIYGIHYNLLMNQNSICTQNMEVCSKLKKILLEIYESPMSWALNNVIKCMIRLENSVVKAGLYDFVKYL